MVRLAGVVLAVSTVWGQLACAADQLPVEAKAQLQRFVGIWAVQGSVGEAPLKGTFATRWAPAGHCLLADYAVAVGDRKSQGNILFGWDPNAGEIRQLSFFSDGLLEYVQFKQQAPGQFTGEYTSSGLGQQIKCKCKLNQLGPDKWVFTTVGFAGEGNQTAELQVTMTRASTGPPESFTTREEFVEFGNLNAGRWVGDITLIADWPGISKKQGEKVNSHLTVNWIADGSALAEKESVAESEMTGIVMWHSDTKQIKAHRVTTAGDTSETVFWKQEGQWRWNHSGAVLGGKLLVGSGTVVSQDNGNTLIFDGTLFLDGEKLPQYHDVYTRVNK